MSSCRLRSSGDAMVVLIVEIERAALMKRSRQRTVVPEMSMIHEKLPRCGIQFRLYIRRAAVPRVPFVAKLTF